MMVSEASDLRSSTSLIRPSGSVASWKIGVGFGGGIGVGVLVDGIGEGFGGGGGGGLFDGAKQGKIYSENVINIIKRVF